MCKNICSTCYLLFDGYCYCSGEPEKFSDHSYQVTKCDYFYDVNMFMRDLPDNTFINGFRWACYRHNQKLDYYKKLEKFVYAVEQAANEEEFPEYFDDRVRTLLDELGLNSDITGGKEE